MKRFLLSVLVALLAVAPVTALADTTKACQVVGSRINPTEARTTDDFIDMLSGTVATSIGNQDNFTTPVPMILSNLVATVSSAPGAGDSWVLYFVSSGTRIQGLTCTIAGTDKTCLTGQDEILVPANSILTLVLDSGEGASDPAGSSTMSIGACVRKS